jgi:hypothetical protein
MATKKEERAARILEDRKAAYAKKVRNLVGFMFGRIKGVSAAFDKGISADEFAAQIASKSIVGAVIHPLKMDAVRRARDQAEEVIARVKADIEAHAMDRNAAAPYPPFNMNSRHPDYVNMKTKHDLYYRLTENKTGTYREGQPDICTMSKYGCDRMIAEAEAMAAQQYDAFICKMVSKVGDVVSADIEGSHIWGHSFLTVVTADGAKQVWKTQQIVNTSSLGLDFNQWPSRIVK